MIKVMLSLCDIYMLSFIHLLGLYIMIKVILNLCDIYLLSFIYLLDLDNDKCEVIFV